MGVGGRVQAGGTVTCAHFDPGAECCAAGINYQRLTGGGVHYMVLRLPCLPLSNRRGEEARPCAQFAQPTDNNEGKN